MIETHIPGYEIISVLAKGGMAIVCRAIQTSLGRPVALKLLPPRNASDPDFVVRFQREASTAAALEHPNIVSIYDFGQAGDTYYIAMQLVDGQPLSQMLRDGPIPVPQALTIMEQVGAALDHAHRQGVVHRDVKPGNIIVQRDGTALIMDFGLARAVQSAVITSISGVVGTPGYMPPEQCMGETVDFRADLYSLGVIAFEMLTGRRPFEGEGMIALCYQHINEPPPVASQVRAELGTTFDSVLQRALAKRPTERFQSAAELVRALESADRSAGPESLIASVDPALRRKPRFGWVWAAAAVILVGALAPLAMPRGGGDEASGGAGNSGSGQPVRVMPVGTSPTDRGTAQPASLQSTTLERLKDVRRRYAEVSREIDRFQEHRLKISRQERREELEGLRTSMDLLWKAFEESGAEDSLLQSRLALDRGVLAFWSGHRPEARDHWKQAVEIDPGNRDAREWLVVTQKGSLRQ